MGERKVLRYIERGEHIRGMWRGAWIAELRNKKRVGSRC